MLGRRVQSITEQAAQASIFSPLHRAHSNEWAMHAEGSFVVSSYHEASLRSKSRWFFWEAKWPSRVRNDEFENEDHVESGIVNVCAEVT